MPEDAGHGEKMIQARTGAPLAVIRRLETADDWTFIITIHAMLEAALNNLITQKLGRANLSAIIARLDTGDKQTGKLVWAKELGIWGEDEWSFVRKLSPLRNTIVHDITKFEFTLESWIASQEPKAVKDFVKLMHKILIGIAPDWMEWLGNSKPDKIESSYLREQISLTALMIIFPFWRV